MALSRRKWAVLGVLCATAPAVILMRARGSDHADTPAIAAAPGGDLTDVFIFPSPANANNVVLVMNVHPLITAANAATTAFDPDVLYQFKIDNNGDNVEDLVIQAKFNGTTAGTQTVQIAGPVHPTRTGTTAQFETPDSVSGTLNTAFTLSGGTKVFAGAREDPFFFDLNAFFQILPDRKLPLVPNALPAGQNPNAPQKTTFNGFAGQPAATDFLKGFNVLSIVVELPKSQLTGSGTGKIGMWCTTSR